MPKRYFALPEFMFRPDPDFDGRRAFDAMSRTALRVLLFLFSQYKGRNNGDFSIAPKICADNGFSRNTAREGVAELAYLGLVIETRRGGLNRSSLYGFTWLGLDEEVAYKFDDNIKASPEPMRCWMLQYRSLRTRHLCLEHEAKLQKKRQERAERHGEYKKVPPQGDKQETEKCPDLCTQGDKKSESLAPPGESVGEGLTPPGRQENFLMQRTAPVVREAIRGGGGSGGDDRVSKV
jgi:hypothetical protein